MTTLLVAALWSLGCLGTALTALYYHRQMKVSEKRFEKAVRRLEKAEDDLRYKQCKVESLERLHELARRYG